MAGFLLSDSAYRLFGVEERADETCCYRKGALDCSGWKQRYGLALAEVSGKSNMGKAATIRRLYIMLMKLWSRYKG
jgi:hypothetical protein